MTQVGNGSETLPSAGSQAVTTSALALNSGTGVACSEVLVQNDPGSANIVLVGNSTAQAISLAIGEAINIEVTNIAAVYVKVASGSATVNWLARS